MGRLPRLSRIRKMTARSFRSSTSVPKWISRLSNRRLAAGARASSGRLSSSRSLKAKTGVLGEVARRELLGPGGGDPIAQQRDQGQRQQREPGQPAGAPRRTRLEKLRHAADPGTQAGGHQGPEEGERTDEEVVPLAHLPLQ